MAVSARRGLPRDEVAALLTHLTRHLASMPVDTALDGRILASGEAAEAVAAVRSFGPV
jgi:hypothetical protein